MFAHELRNLFIHSCGTELESLLFPGHRKRGTENAVMVFPSGVVSGMTVRALVLGRFSQKKKKIELKDNARK